MKAIILLIFTFSVYAQFTNETIKKIDKIENNSGTDIEISPSNDLIISSGVANRVPYFDSSKKLLSSSVTDTELGYLQGATSNLQSQIDGKEPTINLTPNRAVISDGLGALGASTVTDAEILSLTGISSNVQTQIDSKQDSLTGTNGDLFFWNTTLQNLGIGTEGQVLKVSSGLPSWETQGPSVSVTTKGDIQTYSTAPDRLPVGTNGQLLQANDSTSTGLEWIDAPSTSPTTTEGDLILRGATEDERLPIGTNGQLLTSNGTTALWSDPAPQTTLTTKGDLQGYSTQNERIPVGNDNEVLFADSNETTGVAWKDPATVVFSVAQHELIGSAEYPFTTNCTWALSSDGTFPVDNDCPTPILKGDAQAPSTKIPAITFASLPAGTYTVTYGATRADTVANAWIGSSITDGTTIFGYGGSKASVTGGQPSNTTGVITYDTPQTNVTFQPFIRLTGGQAFISNVSSSTASVAPYKISVFYTPPSSQIVRQATENFSKSLGQLFFEGATNCDWTITKSNTSFVNFPVDNDCPIPTKSTGAVIDYDGTKTPHFILPSGSPKGMYKVRFGGIFHNDHNTTNAFCSYRVSDGTTTSGTNSEYAQSSDTFDGNKTFELFIDEETTTDRKFELQARSSGSAGNCILRNVYTGGWSNTTISVEYVPTDQKMTITGSFDQIKSDSTPIVIAKGNGNESITGTTDIPFVSVKDNFSAWDGNSFTVPEDQGGQYLVAGSVHLPSNAIAGIYIALNGVREPLIGFNSSSTTIHPFSGAIELSEGDVISIRSSGGTAVLNNAFFHHIHIQKIVDVESLVKNLNDNKNLVCEKKYQSSSLTSNNSNLTDLEFTNLTVGKKYEVYITGRYQGNTTDTATFKAYQSSTDVCKMFMLSLSGQTPNYQQACTFTASQTSLNFAIESMNGTFYGGNSTNLNGSRVRLCELPDNYIDGSF